MPTLFALISRRPRQVSTRALAIALFAALFAVISAVMVPTARAQDVQAIPALTAHVIDQTDTLKIGRAHV